MANIYMDVPGSAIIKKRSLSLAPKLNYLNQNTIHDLVKNMLLLLAIAGEKKFTRGMIDYKFYQKSKDSIRVYNRLRIELYQLQY